MLIFSFTYRELLVTYRSSIQHAVLGSSLYLSNHRSALTQRDTPSRARLIAKEEELLRVSGMGIAEGRLKLHADCW